MRKIILPDKGGSQPGFGMIYKRRVEQRRREIARNATQTLEALKTGKAKRGTLAELRADLLSQE